MLVAPGGGSSTAFAGMGQAIDAIAVAARSGGFGISHNGGQALINAIGDLKNAVEDALVKSDQLAQQPKLGTTPAATVFKPFLATVASDPVQGAIPVLKQLHADLINAHAAIQQAMQNFQNNEQAQTSSARSIQF